MDDVIISGEGQLSHDAAPFPVKFMRLHEKAVIPQRGTIHSAGYDLYAVEEYALGPHETALIPLGFATEIHPSIHGRIESRSGMASKGLVVLTGVIDADYRGQWHVILHNLRGEGALIAPGNKIAQVVFRPTVAAHWTQSEALESSQRGSGGFGSTGS